MPARRYISPVRAAAAAATRQEVIAAAILLLRDDAVAAFTLEAVARRAGVTRLTVYNQFGSRLGLLEAVLDDLAVRGDLERLATALDDRDPWRSLDLLVEIICAFWSSDPAMGRLQEAVALDRDFAQAVRDRNERRRSIIGTILRRLDSSRGQDRCDATDLIFSLTSHATYGALSEGRSPAALADLLKRACRAAAVDHGAD